MNRAAQINATGGWGRPRLLATLAAGAAAALLFVVGLGLALIYGLRGPDSAAAANTAAPKPVAIGSGPAYRDQLAAQPMLQVTPEDARAGVPAPVAGPVIQVPPSSGAGPEQVPSGFPHSPQGAIGQLAAIEQAVLQGMNIRQLGDIHTAWALPGAPTVQQWPLTQNVQAFLASAQMAGTLDPTSTVVATPVAAQVKGVDGPDWVLACVLVQVRATISQSAQMGYGYCERMTWHGDRWMIAPGQPPAPAPSTWPGTELSARAGWRTWSESP